MPQHYSASSYPAEWASCDVGKQLPFHMTKVPPAIHVVAGSHISVFVILIQNSMCCRHVYREALLVHKCMKIADAAA
jgi:hypothetical protein